MGPEPAPVVIDMRDVEPAAGAGDDLDAQAAEPTQAEIDEWAAREKARREAWLAGPTDEERRAYAKQREASTPGRDLRRDPAPAR